MAGDIKGVIISIAFVFLVIVVSELLRKRGGYNEEFTRKFVHIGVAHWWIVAMFLIKDICYALIPPVIFVVLNFYSNRKNLFKSMEREGNSDLGTVYFPISLIVLILLTWDGGLLGGENLKYLGAVGSLIMGYGDGFAAIIGKKYGGYKYKIMNNEKSLEGSLAMFVCSFLVSLVFICSYKGFSLYVVGSCFIVSVLATIAEALTPFGMDNLTVPIISTLSAFYFIYFLENNLLFLFVYSACIGFLISFAIAYFAYIKNSLTLDGSIGATLMGTLIHATSGFFGSLLMILFFISSSILSRFKNGAKKKVALQFDKTGQRDAFQVFANGGVGLIYSILFYITQNPSFLVLFGISFAAANADTWATELGILNKKQPISLRTLKPVDKGTSGAISILGTFAALIGSMLIGIFVTIGFKIINFEQFGYNYMQIFKMVTLGGFTGSMIDSILGATLQGIYYSDEIKGETEKKEYNGKPTLLVRGLRFMNNDLVNFLSIGLSSIFFAASII